MSTTDKVFDIIAEETGLSKDEVTDGTEFIELGIEQRMSKAILTRIAQELKLNLPATTFEDYPDADELKSFLSKTAPQQVPKSSGVSQSNGAKSTPPPAATASNPLSFVLQGKPHLAQKTLFLLPDGAGSGMAYARLPKLDSQICLVALNSPYLKAPPTSTSFTLDDIAALWTKEIQSKQPHGPYYLGGWSAGGYYSFEVAKQLMAKGEEVKKLILLDSPCRLVYEALPMEVVRYLSSNGLMGNWGDKGPPTWMVDHFDISIAAIERYMPTPLQGSKLPDVHIIWAAEGALQGDSRPTGLDMSFKITQMMLDRSTFGGPMGWEGLFPGAKLEIAMTPGNHFTMVYPPNCDTLSTLLRDSCVEPHQRTNKWTSA